MQVIVKSDTKNCLFRCKIKVFKTILHERKQFMANKMNSLSHTKWMRKYHVVFTLKYRRKIIYNQYRESIREILKKLCLYKGIEIIEGHLMTDHLHMLVSIPPISKFVNISPDIFLKFYITSINGWNDW